MTKTILDCRACVNEGFKPPLARVGGQKRRKLHPAKREKGEQNGKITSLHKPVIVSTPDDYFLEIVNIHIIQS